MCNCLVTVFILLSVFPQDPKHICFTGKSLCPLFVLNKAYLQTISMFKSLKYYTLVIWIHRLTRRPPGSASVKQILGFILNTDSQSYFDVRVMGNIFNGNSYQLYLKRGYNYGSMYNQIPLDSLAQRPGLVCAGSFLIYLE